MLLRQGLIEAFDREAWTVDVTIVGYESSYLTDVPLAYHVRTDLVEVDTRCVVLMWDDWNPSRAVVIALYGGKPALDPLLDPVIGHKHRGLIGDGPRIAQEDIAEVGQAAQ